MKKYVVSLLLVLTIWSSKTSPPETFLTYDSAETIAREPKFILITEAPLYLTITHVGTLRIKVAILDYDGHKISVETYDFLGDNGKWLKGGKYYKPIHAGTIQ